MYKVKQVETELSLVVTDAMQYDHHHAGVATAASAADADMQRAGDQSAAAAEITQSWPLTQRLSSCRAFRSDTKKLTWFDGRAFSTSA